MKIEGKSLRYGLAALPLLYSLYLLYQHCNGGVPAHHFMANEDYPRISNWYGIFIISLFTYITYLIFHKITFTKRHLFESIIAFAYGLGIYLCFQNYLSLDPKFLLMGLFLIGIFYPIYRINIYFAIVLGMTYGFGAILPAVMISLPILLSYIVHLFKRK